MEQANRQTYGSLEDAARILRHQIWAMALILIVVTAVSFAVTKHEPKKYTATADLVFNQNSGSQQVAGVTSVDSNQTAQQQTDVAVVTLGSTAAETASAVGRGLSAQDVRNAVSARAQAQSNIVQLTATERTPSTAAKIVNTYARTFVSNQVAASQSSYVAAQRVVEQQLNALQPSQRNSGTGLDLQARAQTLEELAQSQVGVVQVAQFADVPSVPSSPRVLRNTVVGGVLGILIALLFGFGRDRFDKQIREPEDLERIYNLPLLAVIPQTGTLSTSKNRDQTAPSDTDEIFRLLRAHLRYFNINRELKIVAIISAAPGDGKSTVARRLSWATATLGSRVLLVEADLRRPTNSRALGLTQRSGLPDVLIGRVDLAEAAQEVFNGGAKDPEVIGSGGSLQVLTAGLDLPPNPAQLLESNEMKRFLSEVRSSYDFIVIDTPPLTVVPDVFPLLSEVDGVLVVGRVGQKNRDVASRLRAVLGETNAVLLGLVANGVKVGRRNSYQYGYGYRYRPTAARRRVSDTDSQLEMLRFTDSHGVRANEIHDRD